MTTTTTDAPVRYIPARDVAKLIRVALKAKFPGVKFSVVTHLYAGGSSINIRWTDGPTVAAVEAVARIFEGERFDGMIDLAYSVRHWLAPDGSVSLAHDPGTAHNGGSNPATLAAAHAPGCEMVRFCSDHVFCRRERSDRLRAAARVAAEAHGWTFDEYDRAMWRDAPESRKPAGDVIYRFTVPMACAADGTPQPIPSDWTQPNPFGA